MHIFDYSIIIVSNKKNRVLHSFDISFRSLKKLFKLFLDICQLQDLLTTNTPTTTIKPAHNLIYKTQQFGALTFHDEHRHVGNKSLIKLETMTPQPRLEKYSSNASAKTRVENLVSSKHHSSNNDLEEAVDDLVFDFT